MTDLSVVIPTYNRLETLQYVIPTLLASDLEPHRYEILVADSNSDDGTAEYLAKIAEEYTHVRHLPGPYSGRAEARNAGIWAAQGAIVLFTDADILASPDLLRRHIERHAQSAVQRERRVAVVGMELQVNSLEEYERLRTTPKLRRPLHPHGRKRIDWLFFLTGNASVRREDLEALSGFDENFTGYGHEDLELGFRLKKYGIPIFYERKAVNYHWHPVPYTEQRGRMELAGRSTVRFLLKHRSYGAMWKLGMSPLSFGVHALLERVPSLVGKLDRAGQHNRFARGLIYQYYYVNGMKMALSTHRKMRRDTKEAP